MDSFKIIEDSSLGLAESSFGSFGVFNTDEGNEVIISAIHFPSKRYREDWDFRSYAKDFRERLERVEKSRQHSRSVIVGDFNINPFEASMIAADCLHAVMDSEIAKKKDEQYRVAFTNILYNPMWGKMGILHRDRRELIFIIGAGQKNYFWHTFDQVLIRPDFNT